MVKTYLLMCTTSKILVKTTRIFTTCTPHDIFSRKSNKGRGDWKGKKHRSKILEDRDQIG